MFQLECKRKEKWINEWMNKQTNKLWLLLSNFFPMFLTGFFKIHTGVVAALTHLLQKSVAPDLPIGPGPCDDASVIVVSALSPVASLYAGDQTFARVRYSHLIVFTGRPEHRPALVIVLNPQGKLAMVIVYLPDPTLLTVIYWQHVPVVSLSERRGWERRQNLWSYYIGVHRNMCAIKLAIKEEHFFLRGTEGDRVAVTANVIQQIHQWIDNESGTVWSSWFHSVIPRSNSSSMQMNRFGRLPLKEATAESGPSRRFCSHKKIMSRRDAC